jgi:ABC-type phosphate transport system ATPase subunit
MEPENLALPSTNWELKLNLSKENTWVYVTHNISSLIRLSHKTYIGMKFSLTQTDSSKIFILADSLAGSCYAGTSRIWYEAIRK